MHVVFDFYIALVLKAECLGACSSCFGMLLSKIDKPGSAARKGRAEKESQGDSRFVFIADKLLDGLGTDEHDWNAKRMHMEGNRVGYALEYYYTRRLQGSHPWHQKGWSYIATLKN